jgi:hypothetical protein
MGIYYFYKRINDRETYLLNEGIQGEAEILGRERLVLTSMSSPRLNSSF